jgi:hypothetical protein
MFCFLAPSSLSTKDLSFEHIKTCCETSHVSSLSERLQNIDSLHRRSLSVSKTSKNLLGLRPMSCLCLKYLKLCLHVWFFLVSLSIRSAFYISKHPTRNMMFFLCLSDFKMCTNASHVLFLAPRLQKAYGLRAMFCACLKSFKSRSMFWFLLVSLFQPSPDTILQKTKFILLHILFMTH